MTPGSSAHDINNKNMLFLNVCVYYCTVEANLLMEELWKDNDVGFKKGQTFPFPKISYGWHLF